CYAIAGPGCVSCLLSCEVWYVAPDHSCYAVFNISNAVLIVFICIGRFVDSPPLLSSTTQSRVCRCTAAKKKYASGPPETGEPLMAKRPKGQSFKSYSVLPGFNLTLGYTLAYLTIIVLVPVIAVVIKTTELSLAEFWQVVTAPRTVASYKLSFGASLLAAAVNSVFGLILAWVLVRYSFPGKKIVDALIDHVRADTRLGTGTLLISRQEDRRCAHRSSFRAADSRCRHLADRAVCPQRLDRSVPGRRTGHQGGFCACRRSGGPDIHRPALRSEDG